MDLEEINRQAKKAYAEIDSKQGLPVFGSRKHRGKKMVFARGRQTNEDNLQPKINRFGYPPSEYCTDFGRANYPGYPVLYAGDSPKVIAEELTLQKNDWFHLGIFHTPEPIDFEYILFLHDELSSTNKWHKILTDFKEFQAKHHPKEHPLSPEESWKELQNAALAFRGTDYKDTAAISHHWIYGRGVDAILYPSIRSDDYCNFALNPKFVDKHLTLYKVHTCRWLGEEFELHYTGVPSSYEISWNSTTKEDYQEFNSGYVGLQS